MIKQYEKIPVKVSAVQWTGTEKSVKEIYEFMGKPVNIKTEMDAKKFSDYAYALYLNGFDIKTKEGTMIADIGDYIIKEAFPTGDRDFYPCKEEIFNKTYRLID